MPKIQTFPFGLGLHQDNDERLQAPGAPRDIRNLIRTKNGRLETRRDYEVIANTGTGSGSGGSGSLSDLELFDLAEYSGNLIGFGRCDATGMRAHDHRCVEDVFELLELPQGNWRRPPTSPIVPVTEVRAIGRSGRRPESVKEMDVAAAGGYVCTVFATPLTAAGGPATVAIRVIEAATDRTVAATGVSSADLPRVVAIGGVFYIAMVMTANGSVALLSFDPATSTSFFTVDADAVPAGASVAAIDMATDQNEETFWIGVARSDTTTVLRGFDDEGSEIFAAAGPAVQASAISVFAYARVSGFFLHVSTLIPADNSLRMDTYAPPATTVQHTTADISGGNLSFSQAGMWADEDNPSETSFRALHQEADDDQTGRISAYYLDSQTDHDEATLLFEAGLILCSKVRVINNRALFCAVVPEGDGFFSYALFRSNDRTLGNSFGILPCCVFSRFLAQIPSLTHLPQIAYDASADRGYVVIGEEDDDRVAAVKVLEFRVGSTDRRQTVELGDVLYIPGAIPQSFDGVSTQEAGGFLSRPVINNIAGNPTGDMNDTGFYQVIVVQQDRDAKGRRLYSAPSNIAEFDMSTFGDEGLVLTTYSGVSLRGIPGANSYSPLQFQQKPTFLYHRTTDLNEGGGTFHVDESQPVTSGGVVQFLLNSDESIEDNEILYTQGARGALSGPLEFVCPEPCIGMAASASNIMSVGLPDRTRFQESRPLFPGEQVNWSDSIGFFRDVRNEILVCARLDERRILFTGDEIFEADGPGLDDNGIGDIGAPRKLPSEVGIYGGRLAWRSVVEISAGLLFQGLRDQIYLLPRGGVTPVALGFAVQDKLADYPDIAAAVYMNDDQTVRFFCNNTSGTESIVLLLNVRFTEWFVEGPYAFAFRAAARAGGRLYTLDSSSVVRRQLTDGSVSSFVDSAWRGGVIHPFGPGLFGRVYGAIFYGTFRGNCRIRCIATFDERDAETSEWVDVHGLEDGDQFKHHFTFSQMKCENVMIDFEVTDLQGAATRGLDWTYWALEHDSTGVPDQLGEDQLS